MNTFSADIDVEGGDLIGLWVEQDTICARATGSSSDTLAGFFPAGLPGAGATFNMFTFTDYRLNVSVELKRSGRSSGGGSSSDSSPLAPEPEPARIAVCTARPIQRTDGTTGTFADLLASEYPATDPASAYYGAVPAKYAQGIGLTCDNLPGYADAGYRVNAEGVRAPAGQETTWPAPYEYYAKTA